MPIGTYMGLNAGRMAVIDDLYRERIIKAVLEKKRRVSDLASQLRIQASTIYGWIEDYKSANNADKTKYEGVVKGVVDAISNTKNKRRYSSIEFRKEMVKKCHEARLEKSTEKFAAENDISHQTLYTWVKRYKNELNLPFKKIKKRDRVAAAKEPSVTTDGTLAYIVPKIPKSVMEIFGVSEDKYEDHVIAERHYIPEETEKAKVSWEDELRTRMVEAENKILREMMNSITKGG